MDVCERGRIVLFDSYLMFSFLFDNGGNRDQKLKNQSDKASSFVPSDIPRLSLPLFTFPSLSAPSTPQNSCVLNTNPCLIRNRCCSGYIVWLDLCVVYSITIWLICYKCCRWEVKKNDIEHIVEQQEYQAHKKEREINMCGCERILQWRFVSVVNEAKYAK